MGYANKLQLNNGTWDIHDERISTGSSNPSGGDNGDIYFKTSVGTVQTSNGWNYITRADGLTECWKTFSFSSLNFPNTWGNCYYHGTLLWENSTARTYPVTFSDYPAVWITINNNASANFWLYTSWRSTPSKTLAPDCGICRANAASTSATSVEITYYVLGFV